MPLYARPGVEDVDLPRVRRHRTATLTLISPGVAPEHIGAVGAALPAHRDEVVPEPLAAS
ncbi:hypothetical protein [Modestobacter marinus]|uniref:hypothetical protein n=1 Tax=Modestobacter marinus TaxID=477641 RepID=UPI001C974083|nr:hypothetical protein [Modestobacter marinus]